MRGERLALTLEIVRAEVVADRALPALAAARRGEAGALVALAAELVPDLREPPSAFGVADPDVLAARLALGRLEATLVAPPTTEAAFEEVAWAILRAARLAPPVSLGEDWDLVRVLIDPARRRAPGIAAHGGTLASAALLGTAFSLARRRSYATGWNDPSRVARIARSLRRHTPERLERVARRVSREVAVYPPSPSPMLKRLPRARRALERLRAAYEVAAREGAAVFCEIEVV